MLAYEVSGKSATVPRGHGNPRGRRRRGRRRSHAPEPSRPPRGVWGQRGCVLHTQEPHRRSPGTSRVVRC